MEPPSDWVSSETLPSDWVSSETLRDLVSMAGVDVNGTKRGFSMLHEAATRDRGDLVHALVMCGADISGDAVDHHDGLLRETPLTVASASGAVNAVEALISRGADVNARGGSALRRAISPTGIEREKCASVARVLLAAGATINGNNPAQLLKYYAKVGLTEPVEILLLAGVDPNAVVPSTNPWPEASPLEDAVASANSDMVSLLISAGADVHHKRGTFISTLLHLACFACRHLDELPVYWDDERRAAIALALVNAGIDVNAMDGHQQTPLHFAIGLGRAATVRALLSVGAHADDAQGTDFGGLTGIQTAMCPQYDDGVPKRLSTECIRALLNAGADPNLHHSNAFDFVIMDVGAENGVEQVQMPSPLKMALKYGYRHALRLLIEAGADVTVEDGFETAHRNEETERTWLYFDKIRAAGDDGFDALVRNHRRVGADLVSKCVEAKFSRTGPEEVSVHILSFWAPPGGF